MRYAAAIFLVLCSLAVRADDVIPSKVTLTVTSQELTYIVTVLQQRPYAEVIILLRKLQEQVTAQTAREKTGE